MKLTANLFLALATVIAATGILSTHFGFGDVSALVWGGVIAGFVAPQF